MQILDFYPKTVAGGIGDTVTIEGQFFGDTRGNGNVFLKNADDGGKSEIFLDSADYISWSDNLIEIFVPSYDSSYVATDSSSVGKPAGTGSVRVLTNGGSADTTIENLIIKYSIRNSDNKISRMLVPRNVFNQSFEFRCDTMVANYKNGAMKAVIDKALRDWTCLTGINWYLGGDIAYDQSTPLDDEINVIMFETLNTNKRAHTNARGATCGGVPIIYECDLSINNIFNWFCDTTGVDIPDSTRDFYSVMLHELGHVHGLKHVIDTAAIMHYGRPSGYRKIDLENDFSCDEGGDWMISFSTSSENIINACGVSNITANPNPPCSHVGVEEFTYKNMPLKIFPNPYENEVNIQLILSESDRVNFKIFDLSGKIVLDKNLFLHQGLNRFKWDSSELKSGMYFIYIQSIKNQIQLNQKIIKSHG